MHAPAYLLVIECDVRRDLRLRHGQVEHVDAALAEAGDARLHLRLDVRRDLQEERVVHLKETAGNILGTYVYPKSGPSCASQ